MLKEEIIRFISIIVNQIKPTICNVPPYLALYSGIKRLVDKFIFYYSNFKISLYKSKYINVVVNKLVIC